MAKISPERAQQLQDRFQELYDNDPELRVIAANREGNLQLLEETFFVKKELNIVDITPKEKWNWLHLCNFSFAAPLPVVEFYIKHGVEINAQDMYGMTPLHYAMQEKNVDGAIALLNAGADPNIENRDKVIPLALIGGMPKELGLLELMLKKGGNVHHFNGRSELIERMRKYNSNNPESKPVMELMEKYA